MTETSRVQQWREGKRQHGLKAVTVWLTTEDERRLKDLAQAWHCSPSALLQQALVAFEPGVPQLPRSSEGPNGAPHQVDVLGLLLPRVHQMVQQEMRAAQAIMTHEVTQTLHAAILSHLPGLVHQIQTESVTDTVTDIVTDTDAEPVIATVYITDMSSDVTDTGALVEDVPPASEEEPVPQPQELWCLWCGGKFRTAEDELRHRAQCRGYIEAPAPAAVAPPAPEGQTGRTRKSRQGMADKRRGKVPAEPLTSVHDEDAPMANLKAVEALINERLKQLPYTRGKAKK